MKVLVTEPLAETGIERLREHVEVDERPGLPETELRDLIPGDLAAARWTGCVAIWARALRDRLRAIPDSRVVLRTRATPRAPEPAGTDGQPMAAEAVS